MKSDDARRATRAPRVADQARAIDTVLLARNLTEDARFLSITGHGERLILTTAALHFTDRTGRFWPKLESLAEKAGVSRSTAARAVSNAAALGLLTTTPYIRPDGTQGSSTYQFASDLLTRQGDSPTTHGSETTRCVTDESLDKVTHGRYATRCVTGESPIEEVLEETLPRGAARGMGKKSLEKSLKKSLTKEKLTPKERRLFDAFADALGYPPRHPREVSKWCEEVVFLAGIEATVEEVRERVAEASRRGWSGLTPRGIGGQWDNLGQPSTRGERRETSFEPSTSMPDL